VSTPLDDALTPVDEDAPLQVSRRSVRKSRPGIAMAAAAGAVRTFDRPPARGVARVKVGYRQVRISSEPDAVRSVELGRLDRGDEIEILESHEGFLRIRTPDEIIGWILRHTIVGAPT
jgi:SH3-like domain-containing protein